MRSAGIAAGVLALVLVVAFATGLLSLGGSVSICRHDAEIERKLRDGAVAAARAFFDKLFGQDAAAYDALSDEAQAKATHSQFAQIMRVVNATGPYANVKLEGAFQPTLAGDATEVACASLGDMKAATVAAIPDATQIHTLFAARSRNNDWALTAWLVQKDDRWRVRGFHVSLASVAGRSAPELLRLGEEQEKKGHDFNAHFLLAAAKATAGRGPDLSFGVAADIEAALDRHKAPDVLQSKAPLKWTLGPTTFTLEQISYVGIGKQLGLVLIHREPGWDGEDTGKAERFNKNLIDAFRAAHPEYKETFGFITARILAPGKDSGWGTVFDAAKGYDTGEPSPVKNKKKPR